MVEAVKNSKILSLPSLYITKPPLNTNISILLYPHYSTMEP